MAIDSQSTADAQGAKEQVQEKAQQAAEQARNRLQDQVDQRSTQVGEQVSSSAQALRSTAEKLRDDGQDGPAKAAEQLAGHAEKVGSYLSDSDADRILHDVEDFARRQPLAVVGIGLFAGFAASRFLKASSSSRYAQRSSGSGYQPPRITSPAARSSYRGSGVDAGSGLSHGGGATPSTPGSPAAPAPTPVVPASVPSGTS